MSKIFTFVPRWTSLITVSFHFNCISIQKLRNLISLKVNLIICKFPRLSQRDRLRATCSDSWPLFLWSFISKKSLKPVPFLALREFILYLYIYFFFAFQTKWNWFAYDLITYTRQGVVKSIWICCRCCCCCICIWILATCFVLHL